MLKVTKSIDFTMLIVRVGLSLYPLDVLTSLKMKIMKRIAQINGVMKKAKIMNGMKSIALGVALVEKGPVPLLTIRYRKLLYKVTDSR